MSKELTGTEDVDYVVCQVCGKRFLSLTRHLICIHDMSKEDYLELYPNILLSCKKTSQRRSDSSAGENNGNYREGKIIVTCDNCNNDIEKYPSEISEYNFCSNKCRGEWRSVNFIGEQATNYQNGKTSLICDNCGNTIERYPCFINNLNFCDGKCYGEWRSINMAGENNNMHGKHISYEQRKQISANNQGISLADWNGFLYEQENRERETPEYKAWRSLIFKRDDYTCQLCGQYGNELNAHHIYKISNYPELLLEINNGITLCYDCHFHKVNQHEKDYEIEFISKIFDNKGKEVFGGE